MKTYSTEGIIIKRSDYGEADKIITLLSPDKGKLTLLAKGIRKLSSKRAGSLELFNRVKIGAVIGRGQLDTLTEVVVLTSYFSWRKHLGRINIAYQLCEVIDKLLPDGQSHPKVYSILSLSLSQISNLGQNWEAQLNAWILEILVDLGYWPNEKKFDGDIYKFVESITFRSLHSPRILKKLSSGHSPPSPS